MTLRTVHNIMFTGHAFIPVERPGVHVAQVPVGIWERYTIARTEYQLVVKMIKAHFTQEQLDHGKEAGAQEAVQKAGTATAALAHSEEGGLKARHIPSPEDYMILANLDGIGKGAVCRVLNRYAPNLTVCPECRVDDFTHVATCSILAKLSTP